MKKHRPYARFALIAVLALVGAYFGSMLGAMFAHPAAGIIIGAASFQIANVALFPVGFDFGGEIRKLEDQMGTKREEQRGLVFKAETEKRDFNDDEKGKFDTLVGDIRSLQSRIDRLKEFENQEKASARGKHEDNKKDKQEAENRAVEEAVNIYLRRGKEALNAEQRELLETRALSAKTGAAGAYTIPTGFANELEVALKSFGGIMDAGTIMETETGETIPHPTMNDSNNVGTILGENTDAGASTDPSFGVINIEAHTFSSKPILVPNQLLEDSAFNLEAYLSAALAERINRAFNTYGTTGTGTNQPQGVVVATTKGADAAAAAVTYDNIVDLLHSVDPAYRVNGKFMMNDSTFKALRKLKDNNGQPIFQLSLRDSEPTTLLGKPVIINNDMANIGTGAKSILFGDFSKYKIRRVKNYGIKRLVERYAEFNQTGFLLFIRLDGKLIDAGTNPIKHLLHA